MLKSICLAAAMVAVAAAPAAAAGECGAAPIAPAIPAVSDLAGKTVEAGRAEVVSAYHQVKAYQASLQPFRGCLQQQAKVDQDALTAAQAEGDKGKDKVASLQQSMKDMQSVYDHTVDTETQVATDFNNLHVAQCKVDTDQNICPKKQ
ncbi:MAG: hypothetical protein KGJ79_04870 [Alphaproteobacteria bacterium]|nr:hypothetical protein [Alphaproteobacteria bacterium]MDE2110455.1 hypothetical protein [Alphaproteobacteria bacterium]MDE2493386.1 hypothetical protein [Alphaproteobacteria bacterium]